LSAAARWRIIVVPPRCVAAPRRGVVPAKACRRIGPPPTSGTP